MKANCKQKIHWGKRNRTDERILLSGEYDYSQHQLPQWKLKEGKQLEKRHSMSERTTKSKTKLDSREMDEKDTDMDCGQCGAV